MGPHLFEQVIEQLIFLESFGFFENFFLFFGELLQVADGFVEFGEITDAFKDALHGVDQFGKDVFSLLDWGEQGL
jgi:hypothetical protein